MLAALSFCSSLHCVIVGKVADALKQREICAGGQKSEVLCSHFLCWVQELPEAFRSLPFPALCFRFTDPGGRELIGREKEKEKKRKKGADWPGLSHPTASYSQLANIQVDASS
jgi:hypothetical protein